jgi:hypothetical protein
VTKRTNTAMPVDPFLAWGRLGLQAMEMFAASAHVIHRRTSRRNSPAQIFAMGSEKVEAAVEASHAMARHWLAMQGRGAVDPWTQWPGLLASGMRPFRTRALTNAKRLSRR